MEFIKTIDAIKWKDGNYEKTEEKTVEDEYAYLFIDCLPPRKFSVYPKNLDDFAIGYCLGEGLIKTNEDIEEIVKNNEPHIALFSDETGLEIYKKIMSK